MLRTRTILVSAAVLLACAAAPPPEGKEVKVMAGSGSFDYPTGGCGGPSYMNRATEGSGFASASYRHESGITGVVEASGGVSKTRSSRLVKRGERDESPPPVDADQIGRVRRAVSIAPRLGYHHDYFGIEAGPFIYAGDDTLTTAEDSSGPIVLPSGLIWAGVPDIAFAQLDFLRGSQSSLGHLPASLGVGHSGDRVRASLAFGAENSLNLDGSFRVSEEDGSWVGARYVQYLDRFGTFGTLTYAYDW